MAKRSYFMVQERTTEIEATDVHEAKKLADIRFGSYQINLHPDVKDGEIIAQETLYQNVPMHLELGHSETQVGMAKVHRDLETGKFTITIEMGDHEIGLMDHMVEISEIVAVGFVGRMRSPQ